jgi:hypothetical protein
MRKSCGCSCLTIRYKHIPCFHYTHLVLIGKYAWATYLPTYLPTCLPACLSAYLSIYVYLSLYLSMALQFFFVGPWPLFTFWILDTVGRTPWTGDEPVARPLPMYRTTQTQNKRTQTYMPWLRFEPTIPAFEWAKTVLPLTARLLWSAHTCTYGHSQ